MMWTKLSIAYAAASLTGCFSTPPAPSPPSEAEVVFAVAPVPSDKTCEESRYFGGVAFTPGADAYVMRLPWAPPFQIGEQPGCAPSPTVNVPVLRFAKDGTQAAPFEDDAGLSDGSREPVITFVDGDPVWAYQDTTGQVVLKKAGNTPITLPKLNQGPQLEAPFAIYADATTAYVAITFQQGGAKPAVNNPQYPCCGSSVQGGGGDNPLRVVPLNGSAGTNVFPFASLFCETSGVCLTGTSDSLVFLQHGDLAAGAYVKKFPKAGVASTDAVTIGSISSSRVPSGLVATDGLVAWAVSVDHGNFNVQPHCEIVTDDGMPGTDPTVLFATDEFSCMHVAIDAEAAYFAIVDVSEQYGVINGLGIGRVRFDDQTVETLSLGVQGIAVGPRRIYLEGDSMYLVDPTMIVKIATSALDGKQDFAK